MISPANKARLRFAIIAAALVPFAIFARLASFVRLQHTVQRADRREYDKIGPFRLVPKIRATGE